MVLPLMRRLVSLDCWLLLLLLLRLPPLPELSNG